MYWLITVPCQNRWVIFLHAGNQPQVLSSRIMLISLCKFNLVKIKVTYQKSSAPKPVSNSKPPQFRARHVQGVQVKRLSDAARTRLTLLHPATKRELYQSTVYHLSANPQWVLQNSLHAIQALRGRWRLLCCLHVSVATKRVVIESADL